MKKTVVSLLAALLLVTALAPAVMATPEKAKQTGKKCDECHKGGGNKTGPHGGEKK